MRKLGRLVVEGLVFVVDDSFARLLRVRVDDGVVGREGVGQIKNWSRVK